MKIFQDKHGNRVTFSFEKNKFSDRPEHVLALCRYQGKWLFTKHKKRGLEFPGGKVEKGETLEQAAKREVYEETGGVVDKLHYIGEYAVTGKKIFFVKAVFFCEVKSIEKQEHYYETEGPVLFQGDNLLKERFKPQFSFIMQDEVMKECLLYIEKKYFIS